MVRGRRPSPRVFPATDVWNVLAAAHIRLPDADMSTLRTQALEYLDGKLVANHTSQEKALELQQYFQGLVFKVLSGQMLSPWMSSVLEAAQKTEIPETSLGLLASAVRAYPEMVKRDQQRAQEIMLKSQSQYLGVVGDKLRLGVEIVKSVFSQNYGIYFVTAVVANSGNVVFFSYKQALDAGAQFQIAGTVKRHADNNTTQLNRVKVLDAELAIQ
jgi:hypothetical protein